MSLPVLDYDRLNDVCAGDQTLAAELIAILLEDVETVMPALAEAIAGHDRAQVREHAHSLKSVSGTVGARQLHALAERLEAAPDSAAVAGLMTQIVAAVAAVRDAGAAMERGAA